MNYAFPEDELKPLSCGPQTRNRENPADIGLNDVLANYSLTLIDSLSTLAILAGGEEDGRHDPWHDFKSGVKSLVELYGDGREGNCGTRACGFDLDSKVQVFETNIRGIGGLLSAHLFAVGELPVREYGPKWTRRKDGSEVIHWNNIGFTYDGQLLRLAHDLATRLLPAFSTETDLPYPRVNLRHGTPFYQNIDDEGFCRLDGTSTSSDNQQREITETCTAGAGSLVLEFTTLSRLTGDTRFETLAKKAFWAVWSRRSITGLVGGGIDAESGQWTMPPLAGIGAGVDSFFEYAFKSYILLSGLATATQGDDPEAFLDVWHQSHAAIHHHISRHGTPHPYYGQSDLVTGAPRYAWIDNLSAYYPGLLVLAGELDEAIESHLLFSALWTRYSALPERWHVPPTIFGTGGGAGGFIDPNFKHWAGRPEFIESTYYLYQATKDPYYLHVGEMALRDIRRRCWTQCGWATLSDVVSGEQSDRMESFFLGETAKYLYLLFEPTHPLNKEGSGVVFTTEGHPLVIPRKVAGSSRVGRGKARGSAETQAARVQAPTCPAPPPPLPLTFSNIANRHDLFHASALAHLHLVPINPSRSSPLLEASNSSPGISLADIRSPTNYTFYPWTLPQNLIPAKGISSAIWTPVISTLTFPDLAAAKEAESGQSKPAGIAGVVPLGALQKVLDGVLIHSLSNVRLSMVQEPKSLLLPTEGSGELVEMEVGREFRVQGIANWALGRDEKVLVSGAALEGVSPSDPHFTRIKDLEWVDLVVDVPAPGAEYQGEDGEDTDMQNETPANRSREGLLEEVEKAVAGFLSDSGIDITNPGDIKGQSAVTKSAASSTAAKGKTKDNEAAKPSLTRTFIPAILPTGAGAAPLPTNLESTYAISLAPGSLPLHNIFFLDSTLCTHTLPLPIAKSYNILVLRRGDCSFNEKLANIPVIPPSTSSTPSGLQLVIVLDDHVSSDATQSQLVRPLLDTVQTTPSGLERRHPIAMCMVDGRGETEEAFRRLASDVGAFDAKGKVVSRRNEQVVEGGGVGVKRRFWFESMGVPIGNLIML